jgi:hypothetical protein
MKEKQELTENILHEYSFCVSIILFYTFLAGSKLSEKEHPLTNMKRLSLTADKSV